MNDINAISLSCTTPKCFGQADTPSGLEEITDSFVRSAPSVAIYSRSACYDDVSKPAQLNPLTEQDVKNLSKIIAGYKDRGQYWLVDMSPDLKRKDTENANITYKLGVMHHVNHLPELPKPGQIPSGFYAGQMRNHIHPNESVKEAEKMVIAAEREIAYDVSENHFELTRTEDVRLNFKRYTRDQINTYTSFISQCAGARTDGPYNYVVIENDIFSTRFREPGRLIDAVINSDLKPEEFTLTKTFAEAEKLQKAYLTTN